MLDPDDVYARIVTEHYLHQGELDPADVVGQQGRTWIVVAVPESCWSTDRVLEAIDRTGRTVTERTDLDGPAALLLVE